MKRYSLPLTLALLSVSALAKTTFRDDRLSLNGAWKFNLRRDNQLTGSGPVSFGPVSASSQTMMIAPWPSRVPEGRWQTAAPWPLSATILDTAPPSTGSQQLWKPHPDQKGASWWRADLGQKQAVSAFRIRWVKPAQVTVAAEVSDDGIRWTAWSKTVSRPDEIETTVHGPATSARHVRLTFDPAHFEGTQKIDVFWTEPDGSKTLWQPRLQRAWYEALRKFSPVDGFPLPAYRDADWKDITVPGYWEVQRFSEPTWWQPDDAVGYYRRTFTLPPAWRDRTIRLRFEGVNNSAEVWVNGHEIGFHESGFTAFEFDVTPHLKFDGENSIAVRVAKWTLTHEYDTDDAWFLGGIWRDVYLYSLPASRMDDYWVRTEFDPQYRDAVLRAQIRLRTGEPHRAQNCTIEGVLYDADGTAVSLEGFRAQLTLAGRDALPVELASVVRSPRQWTAETPYLYSLVLRLRVDGVVRQEIKTAFGFRQVEVKGHSILLNGVPLKLRGVVTTRANPNDAGESWDKIFLREIRILKEGSINAIRSHTTPLEEDFLDLCDRYGIYVIPDVPDVWVNEHDFRNLTEGNVQRAAETFEQHKNHTSVIAWHIGNENGPSSAFRGMGRAALWLHEADRTRPVMICGDRADLAEFGTEVNDLHYFPMSKEQFKNPTSAPVLFGEFHAVHSQIARQQDQGFIETWGRSFKLEWAEFEKRPWVAGGLICCWDDGSVNGNLGPRQWGVVDSKRQAKPVHQQIREVFCPVRLALTSLDVRRSPALVVSNGYNFTDLAGYRFSWKLLEAGSTVRSGTETCRLAPGNSVRLPLGLPSESSAEVLEVEVFDSLGYSIRKQLFRLATSQGPTTVQELLRDVGVAATGVGKTYQVKSDPPAQLRILGEAGQELLTVGGLVVEQGRSKQGTTPVDPLSYGQVQLNANSWLVPVTMAGKLHGSMRVDFGASWIRVSYDLTAAEAVAVTESGIRLRPAAEFTRITVNRNALWSGWLEVFQPAELLKSVSRRDLLWSTWSSGNGALLISPIAGVSHVRPDGDPRNLVVSDFLTARDFLGKFDRETVVKNLNPGDHLTGGFTLYLLNRAQAAALEELPPWRKDLTWPRHDD